MQPANTIVKRISFLFRYSKYLPFYTPSLPLITPTDLAVSWKPSHHSVGIWYAFQSCKMHSQGAFASTKINLFFFTLMNLLACYLQSRGQQGPYLDLKKLSKSKTQHHFQTIYNNLEFLFTKHQNKLDNLIKTFHP